MNPVTWDRLETMSERDQHIDAVRKAFALHPHQIVMHHDGRIVINAERSDVAHAVHAGLADYGVSASVVGHMLYL